MADSTTPKGIRLVNENILQDGRALVYNIKPENFANVPIGSIYVNPDTGVMEQKLAGETDWTPAGINDIKTLVISRDTVLNVEVFTVVTLKNSDGTFTYKNADGQQRTKPITANGGYVFELENGTYFPGRNALTVTIDDVLDRSAASGGVTEISENRIAVNDTLSIDSEVTVRYYKWLRIGNPYPRIFMTEAEPATAQEGDLYLDQDGSINDYVKDLTYEQNVTLSWSQITGTPTTLKGYGILDNLAQSLHTHTKKDITDFPTSFKASGGNADTCQNYSPATVGANKLVVSGINGKIDASFIPHLSGDQAYDASEIKNIKTYPFEKGMIIDWYGYSDNVPVGWKICDGNNGTPNLIGRFIIGASYDGSYPQKSTGGEASVVLQGTQQGNHYHYFGWNSGGGGDGTNTGYFLSMGLRLQNKPDLAGGTFAQGWNGSGNGSYQDNRTGENLVTSLSITTSASQAHNNIPPYCALFKIMFVGV